MSSIDPEMDWHESLGAAVVLETAPDNEYDLSEIVLHVPVGASAIDFARMFVNMAPDARASLVGY